MFKEQFRVCFEEIVTNDELQYSFINTEYLHAFCALRQSRNFTHILAVLIQQRVEHPCLICLVVLVLRLERVFG